ncbi:hypothetical protein BJF92_01715 [Rhizobium rhizosphaerae]|uniref:Uncharacterized protein n=1 Tax=Xaviernesmea rhizosphaerae TaxID=1672749 RepID=A0A1Q9AKL0_9HYPH|nr:hypothetical protein [Xaviernesmea rhizosphaerae]OLP55857.1 hypothetical protein BJF92_01715 [Xaviernesmea rhizosphaerae]
MTKPGEDKDKQANGAGADFAPGQTSKPADIGKDISALSDWLNKMPMMQHPVAAFAAATAVGFGVTSQLAGIMLGAMQGMSDAARKTAADRETPAEPDVASDKDEAQAAAPAVVAEPAEAPVVPEAIVPEAVAEPEAALADVAALTEEPASKALVAPLPEARLPEEPEAEAKAEPKGAPAAKKPKARATASKPAAPRRRADKTADDLKKISGIGPKLEQVLNGLGVTRYAEIAAWSEDDVKRVDAELGVSGRIERDGWVEQARELMKN